MAPPEPVNRAGSEDPAGAQAPAVTVPALAILKKRRDFLAANGGRRAATPGFVLQARDRRGAAPDAPPVRVGFTCSKKVGNAVARNRAKRRLRELARAEIVPHGQAGWDYVLIGRRDVTARRDFARMRAELRRALDIVHGQAPSQSHKGPRAGAGDT
ncbi:ribonuclease P protein component [Oceanomicrobium pacificus]|uniref:Ribonuclease P protein component n=1 Tax=Oceanomicrobium pacificus TaxID=2692916 RepID=A0A6B0TP87_9RHOB|nr:ribonuclease P protein component [Oceanomicrobium pacificus]MXU66430.1 ribonuclease P protein component [Oceanomicrobium pacificus]